MSIDGEQDLRQRLDRALGAVTPRPAPVDGAIRQGRAIRTRRWVAAVTGIAVAAAAAIAVPVVLARHAAPSSVTPRPRHHTVTIHPPGPHAPAGLVAWGTIDGHHWGFRVTRPGAPPGGRGNQCFRIFGNTNCGPAMTFSGPDPVSFESSGSQSSDGGAAVSSTYGAVAKDVAYLKLRLTGGTVLTLHPVRVYGVRAVGFEVLSALVVSLTAYSRHGELATAIPFHDPGGGLLFGVWLRPGQRGLPRVTRVIASGRIAGAAWRATVYQGPWGRCLAGGSGADCFPHPTPPGTGLFGSRGLIPQVVFGSASPDVAHVVIVLPDGTRIRVRAVQAGSQKYFAFAVPGNRPLPVRWMAYDSARRPVGSGSG